MEVWVIPLLISMTLLSKFLGKLLRFFEIQMPLRRDMGMLFQTTTDITFHLCSIP